MRESLTAFHEARYETNRKQKAELIFTGNILLALHEQSRLQPVIEQTLAVPFDVFTGDSIPKTNQEMGWFKRELSNRAVSFSREMVLRTVTHMWMTYTLPHREMKLGQDVIAPTGLLNFPPDLLTIEDQRCRSIIQQFDRGIDSSIIFYQILSLYRCNPYRAYCNALYPVHECFRDCLSHDVVGTVTISVD